MVAVPDLMPYVHSKILTDTCTEHKHTWAASSNGEKKILSAVMSLLYKQPLKKAWAVKCDYVQVQ